MRDGPPTNKSYRSVSPLVSRTSTLPSNSPLRIMGAPGEYSSTSTLLQEISSLRSRLKELEDDTKSSVVSAGGGDNNEDTPLVVMLRKDVAQLEQEKAMQEREFMNQLSNVQREHSRRVNELQAKLQESETLKNLLNEKLKQSTVQADELNDMLNQSVNDEVEYFKSRLHEAQGEIEVLSGKVQKAVKESLESRSKTETEDKYMRLLEEQRESHMKEIEQMKEHLACADMEITASREEIDTLQEEVMELQQYRETLLEEVTSARVDCSDEKRLTQSLKNEISMHKLTIEKLQHEVKEKDVRLDQRFDEIARLKKNSSAAPDVKKLQQDIEANNDTIANMKNQIDEKNDEIRDLEFHKQTLLSEITELKLQPKENSAAPKAMTIITSMAPEESLCADDLPITPAEKRQLEKDVAILEERLVRFHSKLADKDGKIEDLMQSLTEERKKNKKLISEIKVLRSEKGSTVMAIDKKRETSVSPTAQLELNQLREKNKLLVEEVALLRQESNISNPSLSNGSTINPSKKLVLAPPFMQTETSCPRTPVSGLVASFERRIGSQNIHTNENNTGPISKEASPSKAVSLETVNMEEMQKMLQREKEYVMELQSEIRINKDTIAALQKKATDPYKNSQSCKISPTSLSKELIESRREIERLEGKLRETEAYQSRRGYLPWKEREELDKLRTETVYFDMQKEEHEATITQLEEEIAKLRSAFSEEKKDDKYEESEQVLELRQQLVASENSLKLLRVEYTTLEEESEEALDRLRKQVEAMQSELNEALTKIEELEKETGRGKSLSVKDIQKAEASYKADMERMELELAMTKARHADLQNEHTVKVQKLEGKISNLEKCNLELSGEIPIEAQKAFEEEAGKLTEELTKSQIKLADMEMEYTIKIKDLEERIKSKNVELEEVKKENENLQKSIDSAVAKSEATVESVANSQREYDAKIDHLSVELTKTQMEKRDNERLHFERLKELEEEISSLEMEAEKEIDAKQDEIDSLRAKLHEKEADIKRLEEERTQLCANISDVSFSRKDDMQELQDELLDLTNKTKSQSREIQSLKCKIDEYEARKEESNSKAQMRIHELEQEINDLKHADRDSLTEFKAENMQLRETIREVKLERRSLKERLESLTQDKKTSKSAQVLRDRNAALKLEVDKLTMRLQKMEDSITRFEM